MNLYERLRECAHKKEREKRKKMRIFKMNSPGAPARLDWSIRGCTIRRRALMNLTIGETKNINKDVNKVLKKAPCCHKQLGKL